MDIEKEITVLKQRNLRVESEKAWETSFVRRFAISIFTYAVAEAWLLIIHEPNSWLKATLPVLGFLLSTLSLPIVKQFWLKQVKK